MEKSIKLINTKHLITVALVLTAVSALFAEDWRGFHGFEKQGRCDSATGPLHWSSSQNVAWKTTIPGRGHSSPIVCGDHVYVTTSYEDARLVLRIINYVMFVLATLLTVVGINFVIQSVTTRQNNAKTLWRHVRLFLFIQILFSVVVVVLFGHNLLSLEGNSTRTWLTAIMVFLFCLIFSVLLVPLKSRWYMISGIIALGFVVPAFLCLRSASGLAITTALTLPLALSIAFFASYFFGRKYQSEVPYREADAGVNQSTQWPFVLTTSVGFGAALVPFMLLIYRAAGYQMPGWYILKDRVKPVVGWGSIGFFVLAVLATIVGCIWRSISGKLIKRFSLQGLFFGTALLLGTLYFVRTSMSEAPKEFIHALLCMDRDTGRVLWNCKGLSGHTELKQGITRTHASATPVTDGERICGYFGIDGLMCVSCEGNLLWKKTEQMFENHYGVGTSPILKEGVLIVVSDVSKSAKLSSSISAFDVVSGEILWKKERKSHPDYGAYGTPLVKSLNGREVVVVHGWYDVQGYDLDTGQILWSYPIIHEGHHLVASLASDDYRLYVVGTRKISALDLSKLGTCNDPLLWSTRVLGEKSSTPVVINGLLFLVTEAGMAYCLEAQSGRILWKNRLTGRYYSSVVTVGDNVLFTSESGQTTVVAIDRKFRQLTSNNLNEFVYASFVPVKRQLFIRTGNYLYCIIEGK